MNVAMTLLRETDLPMVMDWRMRPDITRYMNTDPVLTIDKQQKWFDKVRGDKTQRHWLVNYEDIPIGLINIFDVDQVNSRCSWGYYIAETAYRSLRLAMYLEWSLYDYVFDVMKLNKLCSETFVDNKQVVKLHLLCGGREDGVMRQHIHKNGKFYDVSIISILASEWEEKKKELDYERFHFE